MSHLRVKKVMPQRSHIRLILVRIGISWFKELSNPLGILWGIANKNYGDDLHETGKTLQPIDLLGGLPELPRAVGR